MRVLIAHAPGLDSFAREGHECVHVIAPRTKIRAMQKTGSGSRDTGATAHTRYTRAALVLIGPGSRLAGYEVVAHLGSGGMGEIWLAREVTLERMVALKVLRANLTLDPAPVTRFRQEARAASALNHPNVCTIYGLGETPAGEQFIAMEHIAGDTLRRRLAARPLPLHETLDIAVQVASAI